jgi:hypothetical protein
MSRIGLLNENSLHASLKEWYAQPGAQFEVLVEGYVIDIVQDDLLLEIQTSSFNSIKTKLSNLLLSHQIRLIYPIAEEKWIIRLKEGTTDEMSRRKSPKRGRVEDLFYEMVSFPWLLANPNFSLEVLMIKEEEVRRYIGKRLWRSRGWGIEERRLLEVVGRKLFQSPVDWRDLLPEKLGTSFTTGDLAETRGISKPLAQKMTYCLRKVKVIDLTGKRGRYNLYEITGD